VFKIGCDGEDGTLQSGDDLSPVDACRVPDDNGLIRCEDGPGAHQGQDGLGRSEIPRRRAAGRPARRSVEPRWGGTASPGAVTRGAGPTSAGEEGSSWAVCT